MPSASSPSTEPDTIYAAKTASPLIIGLGEGENFLASDIPAVMGYTRRVLVLEDGDFAEITPDGVTLDDAGRAAAAARRVCKSPGTCRPREKGGYAHFMLKEIHEQPQTIRDTLRGRVTDDASGHVPRTEAAHQQAAGLQPHRHRRLRHGLPCGHGRQELLRASAAPPRRGAGRQRVPLQRPDRGPAHARHHHLAVRRDGGHAGRPARGQGQGRDHAGRRQRRRLQHRPRGRRSHLHLCRPGNLRRLHQGLCHPADRACT